jgi:hypothetical protein
LLEEGQCSAWQKQDLEFQQAGGKTFMFKNSQ